MALAREQATGFTVTFRSVVLRAFKPARPEPMMPRLVVHTPRPAMRRADPALAHRPLGERITTAFTEVPPNETEIRVVGALMRAPGATSAQLSADCGWGQPIWQTHFGLMCERRASYLWPSALPDEPDAKFLTGVLADYRPNRRIFTLKPEAEKALRALDLDWDA